MHDEEHAVADEVTHGIDEDVRSLRLTEQPEAQWREDNLPDTSASTSILFSLLCQLNVASFKNQDSFQEELKHRSDSRYAEVGSSIQHKDMSSPLRIQISNTYLKENLVILSWLQELKIDHAYSFTLYLTESMVFLRLCYPDLAAGSAYKALLLADAARDESDEYHERAWESMTAGWGELHTATDDDNVLTALDRSRAEIYVTLSRSLLQCGCLRSAWRYAAQGREQYPESAQLEQTAINIETAAGASPTIVGSRVVPHSSVWSDSGKVRRERYPWNDLEPERLKELDAINTMMEEVAPKLEVRAVSLPNLLGSEADHDPVVQLGVFAKTELLTGEIILTETSLLTANNRLQDALCDACSADLPGYDDDAELNTVSCEDCNVVFCSQGCHDRAQAFYHPALCDRDVDAIAKDSSPNEAADSLYALLLLRTLALAETQHLHPLKLPELKYIWGDFNQVDADKVFDQATHDKSRPFFDAFPATLPFSFEYNIRLPFHMLEKMDVDIFANPQYDVWVFNTLYAKFRGTASARLSGLGGSAIRGPEVCAVHPMWCLANHSCDPNVSWQWGGSIDFSVRRERPAWSGNANKVEMNHPGIRQGEEILNHYCDVDLPVQERRAWARGALGGDCMCARCVWETEQAQA